MHLYLFIGLIIGLVASELRSGTDDEKAMWFAVYWLLWPLFILVVWPLRTLIFVLTPARSK